MKIMIASDIHGSAYYCRELIKAYKEEEADKLLLLGDILYHGPRNDLPREYNPKEVAAMLNGISKEILCVRGNCEAEVDQAMLDFPVMGEYAILYAGTRMIFATHGHKYNMENVPPMKTGDILLNGHTHVAKCQAFEKDGERLVYMNPGSVSIPKESTPAGYIILEGSNFRWMDFLGNEFLEYNMK